MQYKSTARTVRTSAFGKIIEPIFSSDELKKFSKFYNRVELKAGQQILLEEDGKPGFVVIEKGYARLSYKMENSSHTIAIVGPQELIGCESYLFPKSYIASAIENVSALYFDHEIFYVLRNRVPDLDLRLLQKSYLSISERNERIFTLENRLVKSRVAGTLYTLCKKFGQKRSDFGWEICAPIDRKTMAELSGTVIETLARTLTDLESEGIIIRNGKNIIIIDEFELVRQAVL